MIPLGIIILISLVVFWMDPNSFEDRLGTAMTGLLTAVAYQCIAAENLPKHVYDTYLDSFILLSFLIIILGTRGECVRILAHQKRQRRTSQSIGSNFPLVYAAPIRWHDHRPLLRIHSINLTNKKRSFSGAFFVA